MGLRVNDFRCEDCKQKTLDILFSNNKNDLDGPYFISEEDHNIKCKHCGSSNLIKLVGAPHHSSDGGKGIGARTPDAFKDVLKAIKKGVPEKFQGDRLNSI
jgi:DNA-directed RNA polymerase subunit RPC12/RpoP